MEMTRPVLYSRPSSIQHNHRRKDDMAPSSQEVTALLTAWRDGNREAFDQLMPLVYDELRRLAKRHLQRQSPGHTLQTTALVNEAYLRLVGQRNIEWQNRAHFFAVAANAMRFLL